MNRKFRLSTALDVDDLLMECIPYAIKLANEKYQFDPPLTIYEVDRWGKLGTRADVIFEYFSDPEFFRTQPVIQGAKEFVRKLSQMTEVFISTAVPPQFMGIRAQRIMEEFPEIPADHIYMGARKDKLDVDILFDDGMHNVFKSNAAYPILLRRPWNEQATGMLAVNSYDAFLKLVEVIINSYAARPAGNRLDQPGIVVLVGPSGSGKTQVAQEILQRNAKFEKLVSYTTNAAAAAGDESWYHHVSEKEFHKLEESGEMFESTRYGNYCYGSRKSDVEAILASGRHVLTVMDICGAMAMKTHFDNVITVYLKRDKRDLLADIVSRDIPVNDKVNRLLGVEAETQNAQICDIVARYEDTASATDTIFQALHLQ